MDILLDIVHSVDYGVLAYISEHWRGGLSDTVWKVFSLLGSYGAVWIALAVLLLFFRRTRRAGAAMLIALGVGFLLGNVFLKNLVMRPRPFVTHSVHYPTDVLTGAVIGVLCGIIAAWLTDRVTDQCHTLRLRKGKK